uniref:Uncharacterized protein n=1 Tax=Arundo donax TaxID=35708 RepID=A0A0A9BHF9_ARUDO
MLAYGSIEEQNPRYRLNICFQWVTVINHQTGQNLSFNCLSRFVS